MKKNTSKGTGLTIGVDLGDRQSAVCVLNAKGKRIRKASVATNRSAFTKFFKKYGPSRVVMEVGAHSPWASRAVKELKHEVIVANARKVRAIYENDNKSDVEDAEILARIGRMDVKLLRPIEHRSYETQVDLALIRARDAVVKARTQLINSARGMLKSAGVRAPKCSADSFAKKVGLFIPEELQAALVPVMETIAGLTEKIHNYDGKVEGVAKQKHPETEALAQISGVGRLTALAFLLILEDPKRFRRSRAVGAYLGLRPRKGESGTLKPQLGITKAGDTLLRRLLVQSAHYILGPFGPDTDLRRFGMEIMRRGGKSAKKRAAVAVARKLAVLMHRLWVTKEVYEPLRNARLRKKVAA